MNPDYFKILEALNIKEDLVINCNAKIAIRKRTHGVTKQKRKRKFLRQKESNTKKPANYLEESSDAASGFETSKEDRTQQEEKDWESFDELEKIAGAKIYESPLSIRKHKKSTKKHKIETK